MDGALLYMHTDVEVASVYKLVYLALPSSLRGSSVSLLQATAQGLLGLKNNFHPKGLRAYTREEECQLWMYEV